MRHLFGVLIAIVAVGCGGAPAAPAATGVPGRVTYFLTPVPSATQPIPQTATPTSLPATPTKGVPATATVAPTAVPTVPPKDAATVTPRAAPINSGQDCPATHPIKGNRGDEWIYHMPGQSAYKTTKPEECFSTEDAAKAAGYRKSQR